MENEKVNGPEKKSGLDYLKDVVKYLGFGDKANAGLETAVKENKPEFSLKIASHYDRPDSNKNDNTTKDLVSYELHFKKGNLPDTWFFNNYKADMVTANGENRSQQFFIEKGKGITAKEAYNLLSGRAVHKNFLKKDGEKFQAFIQYDFKSERDNKGNYQIKWHHENYGYKVEKALEAYPIKFESPEQKTDIIKSIEKGNAQLVNLENGRQLFAIAEPQFKDIKFLDNQNKPVRIAKLEQTEKSVTEQSQSSKAQPENKATTRTRKLKA